LNPWVHAEEQNSLAAQRLKVFAEIPAGALFMGPGGFEPPAFVPQQKILHPRQGDVICSLHNRLRSQRPQVFADSH